MPVFNQIITLSKRIAAALLRDEEPIDLHNSELFNNQDKQYILDNLTNETLIKERLNLSNQINKVEDWKKLKSKIEVPVRKLYWKYAAAAILVIALASTYLLKDTLFNNQIESNTPIIVNNQIEPGIDKATLTLEDGTQVTLEKGTSYQTKNANSNGEEIIYINNTSPELVFNYLTIPRGGQFQLALSDGTRVWLNSETKLKYPVSFTDGESRQVELVYGEAYFEVSPSTKHKGANFKVFNNNQEVEVLGTKFNIKAYKDETMVYTTLAEGKVEVKTTNQNKVLNPNQQSVVDVENKNIEVASINVRNEIAWMDGEFILKGKDLKEIMKALSRWYDMDVTFANKELENVRFVGVLGKDQNIEDILNTIKSFGVINSYEINNKKVILK
ncbi:MAG: FecR family protein [Xanthomarina gelatinilytica]|uniref:FecR family protein n=1 Tax=Xanthomarina gelatinilytica TaxID=1137281 RepID=UPI003A88F96A